MIAIVSDGPDALEWNQKCLNFAESSTDLRARNWRGSLLNNLGWTLFDSGRHDEALGIFTKAVEVRAESGKQPALNIAHWCVGHCLRILGRLDDALAIQLKLLENDADGFAFEEAAECLLALGRTEEAKPYFKQAAEKLANQVDEARLERLRSLGT